MSIRVGIVGPTSYTGVTLVELLLRHPSTQITYLASRRDPPPNLIEQFPQLLGRLPDETACCQPIDADAIAQDADVVFTCLPHQVAMQTVPDLLDAGLRVIDLSADYRLADAAVYEKVYHHPHSDPSNLAEAAYGLPELFRDSISGSRLVANPGCYPTPAALAIAPLLSRGLVHGQDILINAASGVTGAGRTAKPSTHFPEHNESYYAYGTIGGHRHQPEIIQALSHVVGVSGGNGGSEGKVSALFVPHLLPIDRGILETIYLDPAGDDVDQDDIFEALKEAYDDEPFVRVRNDLPNVKHVRDTNFCDITARFVETQTTAKVVLFSAIDNLMKGASGQAVQNMNIMLELDESAGLLG